MIVGIIPFSKYRLFFCINFISRMLLYINTVKNFPSSARLMGANLPAIDFLPTLCEMQIAIVSVLIGDLHNFSRLRFSPSRSTIYSP